MIGSMFFFGARVRELISAFAEAAEAIMASDPRSRARVLGKRATDIFEWVSATPAPRGERGFSTACNANARRQSACVRRRA
jgi:hypothetical protein